MPASVANFGQYFLFVSIQADRCGVRLASHFRDGGRSRCYAGLL